MFTRIKTICSLIITGATFNLQRFSLVDLIEYIAVQFSLISSSKGCVKFAIAFCLAGRFTYME